MEAWCDCPSARVITRSPSSPRRPLCGPGLWMSVSWCRMPRRARRPKMTWQQSCPLAENLPLEELSDIERQQELDHIGSSTYHENTVLRPSPTCPNAICVSLTVVWHESCVHQQPRTTVAIRA